ncbi:MAG: hypothetical protein RL637_1823 [Pseudomonadota bacterium]|jgi:protein TonB
MSKLRLEEIVVVSFLTLFHLGLYQHFTHLSTMPLIESPPLIIELVRPPPPPPKPKSEPKPAPVPSPTPKQTFAPVAKISKPPIVKSVPKPKLQIEKSKPHKVVEKKVVEKVEKVVKFSAPPKKRVVEKPLDQQVSQVQIQAEEVVQKPVIEEPIPPVEIPEIKEPSKPEVEFKPGSVIEKPQPEVKSEPEVKPQPEHDSTETQKESVEQPKEESKSESQEESKGESKHESVMTKASYGGCRSALNHYPEAAREQGLEGLVKIKVKVAADGSVISASVVKSSGEAILDDAALENAQSCHLEPATKDGESVASTVIIPIRFKLD